MNANSLNCVLILLNIKIVIYGERLYPGKPYSHRLILDNEGKFWVEWMTDPKSSFIVFNVTAETKGYVAIGFSKTGRMSKSDMVIAGVNRGVPYISDRFTRHDKRIPMEDFQQDWKLLAAWQNRSHTSVRMRRNKDTCDPQDYMISDNTMHLLWAYGENDSVDYHFGNRGSVEIHLLQPDFEPILPTVNVSTEQENATSAYQLDTPPTGFDIWRLSVTVDEFPTEGHWCVFQRGPELTKDHHIVGFSNPVIDENMRKYVQRVVIYKCIQRYAQDIKDGKNVDQLKDEMETYEDYSGQCQKIKSLFPFCRIIITYGTNGKDTFLPKNIGIPFGATDEFYLLETYLISPRSQENATDLTDLSSENEGDWGSGMMENSFDIHTDILISDTPRKFEAKVMKIGYDPSVPLLLPQPISKDFEVFGHCTNECTTKIVDKRKPWRVFGVSFDTGPYGRSATLHHLRNAFELPIILHDGNHHPSFQQMQILSLETPIRYGDQVTVRCKFKNSVASPFYSPANASNPNRLHRCLAYVWYYQDKSNTTGTSDDQSVYECTSKIHPVDFTRWINESTPVKIRRTMPASQILDNLRGLKWTPGLQLSLYELYELGRYRSTCGRVARQTSPQNATSSPDRKNKTKSGTINARPVNKAVATGEITVYPVPVEDVPNTIGCPTLDGPLLLGPPAPVIFGYP